MSPAASLNTPAFRRLAARYDLLGVPVVERKWCLIVHGIALMTPTRGGGASAHNPNRPVGAALFRGGEEGPRESGFYSESRLNRLLAARGSVLHVLLARMFRMLAATDVSFDWREMTWFILNDEFNVSRAEEGRRRIAHDYYRAERRYQPSDDD